jgi:hypothetical protein
MSWIEEYLKEKQVGPDCHQAAVEAYEDGLIRGLCEKGAREAAKRVVEGCIGQSKTHPTKKSGCGARGD